MQAARRAQFWSLRPTGRRSKAFYVALATYIIIILAATPQAQQNPAFTATGAASSSPIRDAADGSQIDLLVGRSAILNVGSPITRVSLTVPDVADAMVTSPTQILVHGKAPGTISLFVWNKAGAIRTYEVKVRRDLSALVEHLKQLFPGEPISVLGSGTDVVISGTVSSQYVVEKAAEVAAGYVEKKENVVNLLKQQEGVASNQVMLRVRFAEVSRSALQELGASFFANGYKNEWFGRTAPPGVAAPDFDSDQGLVFSDFLNLFVFNSEEGLGAVVKALKTKGLFQSLAEPNLIATNGKEASFLAGGEYPYPVVQTGAGANSVTIMFKEFGIRLNFTPTILGGDLIHLKVRPEVSSLDFANAVTLDGFRVPALSTRRTETEVELRDGQTFAIAGLMNNTVTSTMSKIPGIGDIPILGLLFRSKAHQKNQTELVVMITPQIIRRGQPGVSEGLPTIVEPYLGRPERALPQPDAYIGSPRYPVDQSRGTSSPAPAPEPTPASLEPQPTQPMPTPTPTPDTFNGNGSVTPPEPVPSRPIGPEAPELPQPAPLKFEPMPLSLPPVEQAPPVQDVTSAPPPLPMPEPAATEPPPPSREQLEAIERAQEQERRAAEAEAKQRAEEEKRLAEAREKAREEEEKRAKAEEKRQREEQKRLAELRKEQQKKAEEDRKQAERIARERAEREAEIARKNAELARKRAEEDRKREKALAEAAERLREAQAAYQTELERAKGGSDPEQEQKKGSEQEQKKGSGGSGSGH